MSVESRPADLPALDAIAETAAAWMARLHGGAGADRAALDAWLASDPRHARVWEEMNGLDIAWARVREAERLQPGRARVARTALTLPSRARRRALYSVVALMATGTGSAVLLERQTPIDGLLADLHTGTGERRVHGLGDGSVLRLDARTAVDVREEGSEGSIRLRHGAVALETATHGRGVWRLELDGARVQVQGQGLAEARRGRVQLGALAGLLRIETSRGDAWTLRGGESATLQDGRLVHRGADAAAIGAWTDGLLDIRDGTLGDVLDALHDYTPAWLRATAAARRLPVFGVFWLDDLRRTLEALEAALPIEVNELASWVWRIDVR